MNRPLLLSLLLAIASWIPGCGSRAKDPVQAGNDFLFAIGSGNTKEAYDSTAFAFQAGRTYPTFEALAKDLGLTKAVKITLFQQDASATEVKLKGEVLTATIKTLPVSLKLIPERGEWRVCSFSITERQDSTQETQFSPVGKGASFNSAESHEMPTPAVLQKLVENSLTIFNDAIQKQDFEEFYNNVSDAWQKQLTPKRLQNAFQGFIDNKVNLGSFQTLTPIYDTPPQVNSEGLLLVEGHYPTNPYQIHFVLRFSYQFPHWKLFGLDVQLRQ